MELCVLNKTSCCVEWSIFACKWPFQNVLQLKIQSSVLLKSYSPPKLSTHLSIKLFFTSAYREIWHDMTGHDRTWHDMTWHDMTWHDTARHNTWHMMVRYGTHDMVWYGMVWYGMVWYGTVNLTHLSIKLFYTSAYRETRHDTTSFCVEWSIFG